MQGHLFEIVCFGGGEAEVTKYHSSRNRKILELNNSYSGSDMRKAVSLANQKTRETRNPLMFWNCFARLSLQATDGLTLTGIAAASDSQTNIGGGTEETF